MSSKWDVMEPLPSVSTASVKTNGLPSAESPTASSTASDSPTPTNSTHEANWYSSHWQNLVCEEQAQLLGTEEESSDRQSDGEVDAEVWEMTQEQREYYSAKFVALLPTDGLLPGHAARSFFEKSRLPVAELRKIWELADLTKDGALSLDEFNIAMHLVVLRRNHVPLPDTLPASLLPYDSPQLAPVPPHQPSGQPPSQQQPQDHQSSSPTPRNSKQWTKFTESPTNSISSPGPKPVNFDFQKSSVEQDPKILHPVALRVTPGPHETSLDLSETISPGGGASSASSTSNSIAASVCPDQIRPIQRPQAKKYAAPGPGAIPPPPAPNFEESSPCKKEPPPPPPPRPQHRHHTRSSSLDLTRLGRVHSSALNMPPTVPPRVSPGTVSPRKQSVVNDKSTATSTVGRSSGGVELPEFANFAQFPAADDRRQSTESQHHVTTGSGAFHVYKKPPAEQELERAWSPPVLPVDASVTLREAHNLILRQRCHQLQHSLSQLRDERATLQALLDQITSQSSVSS